MEQKSFGYDAYSLLFREYPDVVDVKQLSEMLGGISSKTACRLLQENKIPKIHVLEYLKVLSKLPEKD